MKKIFTLILSIALLAGANAQTQIYSATFTGSLGSWTTVDNTGTSAGVWLYKTNPVTIPSGGTLTFASATAGNGYALFMSDAASNDNKPENSDLTSPAINCSAHNFVFLEFDQYFRQVTSSVGTVFVSNDGNIWNQVYSIDATTNNPEHTRVDITPFAANQPTVYVRFNYQGDWDYFWAIDDVKLVVPVGLDISVDKLSMNKYVTLGSQTVTGTVKNNGGTTITSFDLAYTDNGGSPVTQSWQGLIIPPLQTYDFSFTQPIVMNTAIAHDVSVTVSAPNSGTDQISTNNTLNQAVTCLSGLPHKNALIEEFTTAVCQYCPRGTTTMNDILANHSDQVVGVALHAGFGTDAMTIADHSTIANLYTSGAPAATIDRVLFSGEEEVGVATNVWQTYALQQAATITPVSIIADNTYNATTRQLTVNASARFYGEITDNFRINCYIVEDSVTGTGSGYNQINAYNTVSSSEWYQKGNPIVGFFHRDVVRKMLGGAWGSTGVISATTTDGGIYTKVYADSLKSTWNASRVKLVVLVQHYNTSDATDRNILNVIELPLNSADSTAVTFPTAVEEVKADKIGSISLFPNPATDVVNLNYKLNEATNVSFEVFNILGQSVTNFASNNVAKGSYRTQINTADFNNGVYFVAVKNSGKVVQTLKFVVNK